MPGLCKLLTDTVLWHVVAHILSRFVHLHLLMQCVMGSIAVRYTACMHACQGICIHKRVEILP